MVGVDGAEIEEGVMPLSTRSTKIPVREPETSNIVRDKMLDKLKTLC